MHAERLHVAPDHVVHLLNTTGNRLRRLGQLDTSRPLLDRALPSARSSWDPITPTPSPSAATLHCGLARLGNRPRPRPSFVTCSPTGYGTRTRRPPRPIQIRGSLASMLGQAGQPGQAAAQYRDLLNDRLRTLGPDHPSTLIARANLAYWLGRAGQPDQAAAQFRDLLTDRLRLLGPDHRQTIAARDNLARWIGRAGQPAEAAAQYRDLLTDRLRLLGPDHPTTLTTRGNLAYWVGEAGQPAEAAAQFRDLLTDRLRLLGPDHPGTLITRSNLARSLAQAGHLNQAIAQYRDLLTDRLRLLGPTTPRPSALAPGSLRWWVRLARLVRPQPCSGTCSSTRYVCWDPTIPTSPRVASRSLTGKGERLTGPDMLGHSGSPTSVMTVGKGFGR